MRNSTTPFPSMTLTPSVTAAPPPSNLVRHHSKKAAYDPWRHRFQQQQHRRQQHRQQQQHRRRQHGYYHHGRQRGGGSAGSAELTGACLSKPCANGGLCRDHWTTASCDCDLTSFTGPNCADGTDHKPGGTFFFLPLFPPLPPRLPFHSCYRSGKACCQNFFFSVSPRQVHHLH